MAYEVIKNFIDLEDNNRLNEAGQPYPREGYEPSEERVQYIANKGFIKAIEGTVEDTNQNEGEGDEDFPKHTGGGYYELSNGEKVKGKEEALAAEEALKSGE